MFCQSMGIRCGFLLLSLTSQVVKGAPRWLCRKKRSHVAATGVFAAVFQRSGVWRSPRMLHSETSGAASDDRKSALLQKPGSASKLLEACLSADGCLETSLGPETFSEVLETLCRQNATKHARTLINALCKGQSHSTVFAADEHIMRVLPTYVDLVRRERDLEALNVIREALEQGKFGHALQKVTLVEQVYLSSVQLAIEREQLEEAVATMKALRRFARRPSTPCPPPGESSDGSESLTSNFDAVAQQFESERTERFCKTMRMFSKARDFRGLFLTMDAVQLCGLSLSAAVLDCLAQCAVREVSFVTGAVSMDTMPDGRFPEAAFFGRSNVGKSSLVNMVIGRKALAKTSKTPGKTKQYNFYLVNEGDPTNAFYLVDLPGAGYAKVSKGQRLEWERMFGSYVRERKKLRVLFHLIDSQTGPLEEDARLMSSLAGTLPVNEGRGKTQGNRALHYVVVLTKIDKQDGSVPPSVFDRLEQVLESTGLLSSREIPVLTTSAQTKAGREAVWQYLRLLHKHWR
jgi:GTP-binding protein